MAKAGKNHPKIRLVGTGMKIELDIIKDSSRGYIVRRLNADYKCHAHCKTKNGARLLINLISKDILPISDYLKGSCQRLLTEDEYNTLQSKRRKQQYYNVNKGLR